MAVYACDPSPLEAEAGGWQGQSPNELYNKTFFSPTPKKQTKEKKRRGRGRKGGREEQREVEGGWEEGLIPCKSITEEKGRKAAEQVREHQFSFSFTETGG